MQGRPFKACTVSFFNDVRFRVSRRFCIQNKCEFSKESVFPVTISYLCNYSVCQFVVVLELVRALIEMSWRKRAFLIKRYPRLRRRYLEMPRSPRPTRSKSRRRRWLIYATHPLFALRLVWVNRDSRIFESLIEIRLLIFSI